MIVDQRNGMCQEQGSEGVNPEISLRCRFLQQHIETGELNDTVSIEIRSRSKQC